MRQNRFNQQKTDQDTLRGFALQTVAGPILMLIFLWLTNGMESGKLSAWLIAGSICMAACGFLFFYSIRKKKYNYFVIPLLYIGSLLGVCGVILAQGSESLRLQFILIWIYPLMYGGFIVIAISILIGLLIREYKYSKCTKAVRARCVELKRYGKQSAAVSPVYRFFYDGEYRKLCSEEYTSMYEPVIGKCYDIFINPSNPYEFFEIHQKRWCAVPGIIGIVLCLLVGGFGIFTCFG